MIQYCQNNDVPRLIAQGRKLSKPIMYSWIANSKDYRAYRSSQAVSRRKNMAELDNLMKLPKAEYLRAWSE